jgi:hypothetical protein
MKKMRKSVVAKKKKSSNVQKPKEDLLIFLTQLISSELGMKHQALSQQMITDDLRKRQFISQAMEQIDQQHKTLTALLLRATNPEFKTLTVEQAFEKLTQMEKEAQEVQAKHEETAQKGEPLIKMG